MSSTKNGMGSSGESGELEFKVGFPQRDFGFSVKLPYHKQCP